ncbi:hypothetical protein PGTUg99_017696 [Puccinia graminis f. sp. tritici]|uniref:Tudor domain-containing protein n=1 Tax=Puccinia graminis f. sp. tritici TaxID=56615 RepID=A0A5B0RZ13_PUCGR|nr:hypothetical protein PGTUg99_017696 [Puccinia graminis f. sp. tritici]
MDAKELETYEYQLSQVNLVLEKDPTNAECLSLQGELVNLITLTKDFLAQTGSSKHTNPSGDHHKESSLDPAQSHHSNNKHSRQASKTPNNESDNNHNKSQSTSTNQTDIKSLNPGDLCMAKYAGDGKYYPAKITTIGGSSETRIYTVVFKGYDTTELVAATEIRPIVDQKKRNLEAVEQETDKDRKRKKNEKKTENKAAKAAEQLEKQKSWQSFAKKSVKKGVHIPGIVGDSMFASPDNPFGKDSYLMIAHEFGEHVDGQTITPPPRKVTTLVAQFSECHHTYLLVGCFLLLYVYMYIVESID